jgi:threonylcarbamoyladenosine tRNA methylthiotransferase MtaB
MPNSVPKEIRTKRSKMLRGLSLKKRRAFYEGQLGTTQEVLFESENKNGFIFGFTPNYIKVKTFWNPALSNTIHPVKLTEIAEDGLSAFEFVSEKMSALTLYAYANWKHTSIALVLTYKTHYLRASWHHADVSL